MQNNSKEKEIKSEEKEDKKSIHLDENAKKDKNEEKIRDIKLDNNKGNDKEDKSKNKENEKIELKKGEKDAQKR